MAETKGCQIHFATFMVSNLNEAKLIDGRKLRIPMRSLGNECYFWRDDHRDKNLDREDPAALIAHASESRTFRFLSKKL